MNKTAVKAGVLLAAAAAALVITGKMLAVNIVPAEEPALSQEDCRYTVKAHEGHVALFEDDFGGTPVFETGIQVDNLRAYDRQLLENGITVNNYEDVLRLLEDFGA